MILETLQNFNLEMEELDWYYWSLLVTILLVLIFLKKRYEFSFRKCLWNLLPGRCDCPTDCPGDCPEDEKPFEPVNLSGVPFGTWVQEPNRRWRIVEQLKDYDTTGSITKSDTAKTFTQPCTAEHQYPTRARIVKAAQVIKETEYVRFLSRHELHIPPEEFNVSNSSCEIPYVILDEQPRK